MLSKIKYSIQLAEIASIVIIDGVVCKNQSIDKSFYAMSCEEIEEAKNNYQNILIQNGSNISIYCDRLKSKYFQNVLNKLKNNHIDQLYLDKIKIYTPENNNIQIKNEAV